MSNIEHVFFRVIDTNGTTTRFDGYYIVASFVMKVTDGYLSGSVRGDLDSEGNGFLPLPTGGQIANDLVNIEFYGPGGYWIAEQQTLSETTFQKKTTVGSRLEFRVPILKKQEIKKSNYTVNGRLIDIQGRVKISRKPLHIIVSESEEVSGTDYRIIQTAVTDIEGYFKAELDMPGENAPKLYYFAIIPDTEERIFPLRTKGDLVEERVILALTLIAPATTEAAGTGEGTDCSCTETPRLPSTNDYGSTEGAFSQDLGIGCIEFTKANRVIEEYQFMHVVRTTDPQIRKVNLNSGTFSEILLQLKTELEKPAPLDEEFLEEAYQNIDGIAMIYQGMQSTIGLIGPQ